MKIRSEKHGLEADVYLYQDGDELPKSGTYFVVTGEGYFLHIDGGMVSGLVPCRKEDLAPFLGTVKEEAFYNFPPLPFECFVQALTFLRATYRKHKSEACVIVLYKIPTLNFRIKKATESLREMRAALPKDQDEWSKDQRLDVIAQVEAIQAVKAEYDEEQAMLTDGGSGGLTGIDHSTCSYVVVCPKQRVSGAGVHYGEQHTSERISDIVQEVRDNDSTVEECGDDYSHQFMHVCSIHSHPDFEAYHSGVDDSDEFIWDGLHLTIGGVMKDDFQISASMTLQGSRFMIDPLNVVSGVAKSESITQSKWTSWIAPKQKDLYHLIYDPEDVLCIKTIREIAAKWLKEKVKAGFVWGSGSSWSQQKGYWKDGQWVPPQWEKKDSFDRRTPEHIRRVQQENPSHVREEDNCGDDDDNLSSDDLEGG
tara:strand:- start:2032 stop:3300 length:1269 start_codon:yes stop_codon:yes gene_type:complete